MSLLEDIIEPYIIYRLERFNRLEKPLCGVEGSIKASPLSPEKGRVNTKVPFRSLPAYLSLGRGIDRSLTKARDSPKDPKTTIDTVALKAFEAYARQKGVVAIGYTRIPPEAIFKDRAVLYPYAIILAFEMDKQAVDLAPSLETQDMSIQTYEISGRAANELVDYLRDQGFAAHAGYSCNGVALYTRLAQKASLGWKGRHGLIITPELGPRTRLSVIFTGIENLPITDSEAHAWIEDFCKNCGSCIRSCPEKAILQAPIIREGGTVTHIEKGKCIGCTVCMKACSFNKRSYAEIKNAHMKKAMAK